MVIRTRHPLRFSLGKRVHNKQMRTRCKIHRPKDLADLRTMDSDGEDFCNISVEPWIDNVLKHDFPESEFPAMLKCLRSIDLPQKYFERTTDTQIVEKGTSSMLEANDAVGEGDVEVDDELSEKLFELEDNEGDGDDSPEDDEDVKIIVEDESDDEEMEG